MGFFTDKPVPLPYDYTQSFVGPNRNDTYRTTRAAIGYVSLGDVPCISPVEPCKIPNI